ncbi:proline iminopeptidase-family hydrolase [Dyadobacter sp. CY356]|uniref:proline iminopeptidase-family hydrolase n=1 Tax=Dyadobacter sp. CY356 TaxID=2906442 RepID=UPI001F2D53DB|nr:proline iminopeptidase-family hydrolase [Dyadobacter sp. CY356]MCF0056259.1 proline iminopeptidase-family hydrolase [Dyadobacter sp. CY356]
MKYFAAILFLSVFLTGAAPGKIKPGEGFVEVKGGRIWYKVVGTGKGVPLLLIHGGPGSRSCEGIPGYSTLGDDRPVIFYDQLGSGHSDRPTDTTLWQLPRFVDEIDALRKALDLKELNILGSSWGGTVAVEYMVTKKPKGVKSVIFAGPLISTSKWMRDAKILISQLSKPVQDSINKYESLKIYDHKSYAAATDTFNINYLSRKPGARISAPDCAGSGKGNGEIYRYMWGPTEFNATGTLKNFERTPNLHEITVPVLFVTGRFDEARPETMYEFQKEIPGSKVEIIENSGHNKIRDNPEQYLTAIRNFLNGK